MIFSSGWAFLYCYNRILGKALGSSKPLFEDEKVLSIFWKDCKHEVGNASALFISGNKTNLGFCLKLLGIESYHGDRSGGIAVPAQ